MKSEPIYIPPEIREKPPPKPDIGRLAWIDKTPKRYGIGKRLLFSDTVLVLVLAPLVLFCAGCWLIGIATRWETQSYVWTCVLFFGGMFFPLFICVLYAYGHHDDDRDEQSLGLPHHCDPPKSGELGSQWWCQECGMRWRVREETPDNPDTAPIRIPAWLGDGHG
jgi:hypothetical protein